MDGIAASSSVPRYVDASSMVYTLPSFTSEMSFASTGAPAAEGVNANNNNNGGGGGLAGIASAPMPLRPATSGSDFRLGAPSSPLSPSRRHFPVGSASSPIAIPTYNTTTTSAVEELSCSSPVLRSYRQHSFSTSRRDTCLATSPTSPPAMHLGSSPLSASVPDMPTTLASSSTAFGSSGAAIHTKFLEITGHPLGLENYGNTCYCNSVIQLIYHCTPLRLRLLELYDVYQARKGKPGFEEDTVLYQLCSLIAVMHKSNNRSKDKYPREKIAPRELLQCVRKRNEIFNNDMQQDAHEFTMFLINDIMESEQRIMADPSNANLFLQHEAAVKKKTSSLAFWKHSKDKTISANSQKASKHDKSSTTPSAPDGSKAKLSAQAPCSGDLTPLQVILQGQFGSLTACLECENITAREEVFIDLSLETAQGCSLLRCLDHFGDPEYFWGTNKLRCDECEAAVRAAKTIHVQQLPQYALLIHLKRFQYDVKKQSYTKKADHVALPMQMDVEEYLTDPEVIEKNLRAQQARSQQMDSASGGGGGGGGGGGAGGAARKDEAASAKKDSPDTFEPASEEVRSKLRGVARHKARFELTGFVAHLGEGPNSGHYFTCVRYGPQLWRRFDDDTVSTMAERDVQQYFGVPSDATGVVTTTAYILLYERVA
jgi:ubiquitin carboxyl-terminal hydrolase 12/46